MAVTTTVIFNSPTRAIVKLVGDGAATITLASLADADRMQTTTLPKASISSVTVSQLATETTTIVRNGVAVANLKGNVSLPAKSTDNYVFSENSGSDVVVTLPAGGGTAIITLFKDSGYIVDAA